jgi:hypothetical protein
VAARLTLTTTRAIRAALEELGRAREIEIEGLSEESVTALGYLEDRQRAFLAITDGMRQTALRYAKAHFSSIITSSGAVRIDALFDGIGDAVKQHVLLRFRQQGGDIGLRPLRASTIYSKSHSSDPVVRGNATKIGYATGKLYNELAAARFKIVRG